MDETKPWYLSRTIWASLVTIAAAAAGMAGIGVSGEDQTAIANALLEIVTAAAGLIAIFGRLAAKSRIR
ncbi:MAG: hypothetical protein K5872_04510 [Rhizobiaceae bacterium]|nr:hypothetical protein [Rhizobiaceae bacterium]MCV0405473.1 hypothetical protein [Rhizobiaceae bacterium]